MQYNYKPVGVCSTNMIFDIEKDIIKEVKIENGCKGNLMGICTLIKNQNIDIIIDKLKGIPCGLKKTSCPDQIAQALINYKEKRNQ